MRKIIFTRPNGGLAVVHPVINTVGEIPGFTEAQAEQRAWDKLPKDAIDPQFVEASAIPTDRTYREAWVRDKGKIVVDMSKVKPNVKVETVAELKAELIAKGVLTK